MWTEATATSCRYLCCLCAGMLLVSSVALAQQYRSKILITPEGELSKGASLSTEELEKQIGSIQDAYGKSSAGRHLARHYVEQKQYDKAIEFYRTALAAQGLSDVANREMLRELAQVYLLQKDYSAAAGVLQQALNIDLVPEVTDFLLLAQAHYRMKQYVQVVAALDQIATLGLVMNPRQMHQALALYYQAGAYAQCEDLLRRLLQLEPDNADNWHQLASVYLQQNKKRQALDELTLAREKRVPFSADQLVLLADLQAFHKNPYGAAELLQQAMDQQEIPGDAKNYRKLFEYWFLAREEQKMQAALSRAARLSGDTELYLYLAQLQMEQRAWQAMHQTMLAACAEQLADRYVGRANVLLGISQLKLGDAVNARRSFINATLIAGANTQAAQWLEFMGAEPATRKESRRIVGVCYGSIDKQQAEDGTLIVDAPEAAADPGVEFQIKTVPSLRLFYASYEMPLAELAAQAKSQVVRMGVSLVKSGGSVDGPVQLISQGDLPAQGDPTWQLALPSSGSPRASGRFRVRTTAAFKCAYTALQGAGPELAEQALAFAGALQRAGYSLSGERRLLLPSRDNGSGNIIVELQIGIQ